MMRSVRHRSSPMELVLRLNPQAQPRCGAFSKHGLWRCECTESQQWPPKALNSAQRITMSDAPCERTTVDRGCLLGRGPAVRVAGPEETDQAHNQSWPKLLLLSSVPPSLCRLSDNARRGTDKPNPLRGYLRRAPRRAGGQWPRPERARRRRSRARGSTSSRWESTRCRTNSC